MIRLEPAGAGSAAALAPIHAASFAAGWSAADLAALLESPGAYALVARDEASAALGFILARAIAGEAEILTLAVHPDARRLGVGAALVEAAAGLGASQGAESLFIEVAVDNAAAIALYQCAGFSVAGRRNGYYPAKAGPAIDALIMRRDLNSAAS